MRSEHVSVALFLCALSAVRAAAAAEPSAPSASTVESDSKVAAPAPSATSASGAAEAGFLLPALMAPKIYAGTAYGAVRSGYDRANEAFVARAAAEGSVTDFLALRVEFEHGPAMGPEDRLRVGARLTFLNQEAHGIDGGVALFYDPKDFREEGNVVGALLVGRQFGRLGVFADAMFGSDPEGDDSQLELRLASVYRATSQLHVGLDTRGRYNMSSDEKRAGTQTVDWELQALPTVSLEPRAFVLVADIGVAALQTKGPFGEPSERTDVNVGVLAMGGVAGAF
jgi:hypothetical protein